MPFKLVHFLPISLIYLLFLVTSTEAECYVAAYGLVGKQGGWTACPGTAKAGGNIETCCMPGSECGEDSLCHIPSSDKPGNNSWYQAGCTDSTYQDPVCRNNCADYTQTYINYDSTTSRWMCCGDGGCNGTVTGDTFKAVSPAKWQVITGGSSSSSSLSTTATQHKPTSADFKPSPTSSPVENAHTSHSNPRSGLTPGEIAGMVVAIVVAFLALIAALVAIYMLRRNRRENEIKEEKISTTHAAAPPPRPPPPPYPQPVQTSDGSRFAEAPTDGAYTELPVHEPVHELAGGSRHYEYK